MLYLMTLEPGNDMGNVVAWRDFARPSSIPEEEFSISKHNANFRVQTSKCIEAHHQIVVREIDFPLSYESTSFQGHFPLCHWDGGKGPGVG